MSFDPKQHTIRVQGGREYLPVAARLVWFREQHPDWGILTNPVEINMEKRYAIFSATIVNADGKVMATATKIETVQGFADWIEKAETGAVGRALAYCGFGTQFAPEMEEGDQFADSPRGERQPQRGQDRRQRRQAGDEVADNGEHRPPQNGGYAAGGERTEPSAREDSHVNGQSVKCETCPATMPGKIADIQRERTGRTICPLCEKKAAAAR